MSEKLEALLQAVIDAETDTSYHYASESLAEAAPQILALIKARTPAPEGEAWRHVSQEEMAQAAKFASNNLASPVVPEPEGEASLWGCADGNGIDPRYVFRDRPTAEQVAADMNMVVRPLYASPVVPKTADEIKAVVMAWLDADDPASWGDFEKRLNAAVSDEASPVVPAPEGEAWRTVPIEPTEAMLDAMFTAYILSEGSYRAAYRAMLAASPVFPVGVRERVLDELDKAWLHGQRRTSWRRDEAADAILAALRPTDTGREA
jgi:hypothetical protein